MSAGNVHLALDSIRSAKWRSLLTMLGIIVGVVSVVTIVSLGEGVRHEVVGQINHLGPDLLTIRPGKTMTRDDHGNVSGVNLLAAFGNTGSLSENDLKTVQRTEGVGVAVPLSVVSGVANSDGRDFDKGLVFGTNEGVPQILNQKVEFGSFFDSTVSDHDAAVIGKRVAEQLFHENVPIGRSLQIRGHTFIVHGIFEEFESTPLTPGNDYNSAIFIPMNTAKEISGGQVQIVQILAKPASPDMAAHTAEAIGVNLRKAHGGQEDYTILRQTDNLAIANKVVDLLTGLISGIAAISLIVGGIGIMNIMLVSVSERTHEIGIRKAIGATNRQVMGQFLIEGTAISFVGGLIGVLCALVVNYGLRVFTDLRPLITWQVVLLAVGVSLGVGIFFGVTPALKAARKDPIEALRQNT